jgi:hypothetical protein
MKTAAIFVLSALLGAPASHAASEKALLKKYPKLFSRKGGTIELKLEDGKKKTLKDNPEQGQEYRAHHLFDYLPKHKTALVQRFYIEGGDFVFVSLKDGAEIEIAQKPVWNQKRDLFVSVNEGEYENDKSGLQLGFCESGAKNSGCRLVLEKDGRYSLAKWVTNDRLQATNRIPSADGGEGIVAKVRCTYQRKSKKAVCVP